METGSRKKIMLSGGGTGGSVTTLLAIASELNREGSFDFIFAGTAAGPEKNLVAAYAASGPKMPFYSLPAGKFRRYFSLANLADLFRIGAAFIRSFSLLRRERPDVVLSAGGFVSVPLVWAAYFRHIPVMVHQQDVVPGLANRLMAPVARLVTVTFEKSLRDYGPQAVWTGNPFRSLPTAEAVEAIRKKYSLSASQPFLMVIGGATGAAAINELISAAAPELCSVAQVIHLIGRGKKTAVPSSQAGYQSFELLPSEEVFDLLAAADLVISRAGLATLTELCALRRPAILIPMPASHQEANAAVFQKANAAVVLDQSELTAAQLAAQCRAIILNQEAKQRLSDNIGRIMKRDAAGTLAALVQEILAGKK